MVQKKNSTPPSSEDGPSTTQHVVDVECCNRVSVEYVEKNQAYEAHRRLFTTYAVANETFNGRNYYTSDDDAFVIAYKSGTWFIIYAKYRQVNDVV